MTMQTRLPVGIEDFEEMRTMEFYYVDKTGMIRELLNNLGKVNLFTRPRRFGKTLNMSMLQYFFAPGCDRGLFDGLEISKEKELCDKYMGKFPVISVSLKDAAGENFEEAKESLRSAIGYEAMRFQFLLQSEHLSEMDRRQYESLLELNDRGEFRMSDALMKDSLLILSRLLQKHYGQKAIILIDEYDVPLDKSYHFGYYDAMVNLIRSMFGKTLKTNQNLYFAVLTGCLRVSKESIFTGLNNFNVYTVKEVQYHEYFGFTDAEVRKMLEYYNFMERYDAIKEWYDGYHFGDFEIYCPWDVMSYCHALKMNPSINPQNYWVNTSSNDIIRKFINMAGTVTRNEIEQLINGGSVKKEIRQELTYRDLDSDIDNLWSLLYTTGYLTQCGNEDGDVVELVVPNREIRMIYIRQIREWFKEETKRDSGKLESFCKAFLENDTTSIEEGFNAYLGKMISIRDTTTRKDRKENFYHGLLLGILENMDDWIVMSNAESGEGYSDITVEAETKEIGVVIELKYAEDAAFEEGCRKALQQIREKNYEEVLVRDGMKTIYRYGIACYKKRCKVVSD